MSKKKNKDAIDRGVEKENVAQSSAVPADLISGPRIFPFSGHWIAYIILAVLSFGIYYNSIYNENALDDGIIIQKNEFVLKGTKGIGDILTKDSYYSFYRQMNAEDQLAGGRYRPLSVVSFAIEQQFIGTYPNGVFNKWRDLNLNNQIEPEEVNAWVDLNKNGTPEENECGECWDKFSGKPNFIRDTIKIKDPVTGKSRAKFQSDTIPFNKLKDKKFKGAPLYEEDINQDGNVNDKDCEVEGSKLRHFNNVLFYMISVIVIFGFLRNHLLKHNPDWAFLATLIFAIHPIHTEVVANIKSRDEIFSIIFMTLTFTFAFRYMEKRNYIDLLLGGIMFFFALLSKEYALVLLPVIPLTFYAFGIIDFKRDPYVKTISKKEKGSFSNESNSSWKSTSPRPVIFIVILLFFAFFLYLIAKGDEAKEHIIRQVMCVFIFSVVSTIVFSKDYRMKTPLAFMIFISQFLMIYLAMRFASVTLKPKVPDTEILNNPYLPITTDDPTRGWIIDKESLWATKIFVLLKYLGLLLFPIKLSSDYSFNTIEFRHFKNLDVILSLVIYLGMAGLTYYLTFIKRKKIAFAFLFFFANLMMVGNILFDIGATMGERLVFHSSLGVAVGLAWLFTDGLQKIISNIIVRRILVGAVALIITIAGSYKTWYRNYDWKNDMTLFCKDVETVPNSVLVLGNAGARWIDKSEWPQNASQRVPYLKKAKGYLQHALELHPTYVNGYLNLGLAFYKLHEFDAKKNYLDSSVYTWKSAERLYPNNPYLKTYYDVLSPRLNEEAKIKGQTNKDFSGALRLLKLSYWINANNPETAYNLGGVFFSLNQMDSAQIYFSKCIELNDNAVKTNPKLQFSPSYQLAKQGLDATNQAILQRKAIIIPPK
ncbi:MAG: glycosyltransferase family 39 protein [Bacteroidota bacterium]|jgi:tetratricopeptide (TPR) repeat protein